MNCALEGDASIKEAIRELELAGKYGHTSKCKWHDPMWRGPGGLIICTCEYKYISGAHCQLLSYFGNKKRDSIKRAVRTRKRNARLIQEKEWMDRLSGKRGT